MPCICLPWRSFVLATGGTLARIRRHHNSPRLRGLLGKVTVTDFGSKGNVTDLEKYQNGGGGEALNENFQVLSSHQQFLSTRSHHTGHFPLPFVAFPPLFFPTSEILFPFYVPVRHRGT